MQSRTYEDGRRCVQQARPEIWNACHQSARTVWRRGIRLPCVSSNFDGHFRGVRETLSWRVGFLYGGALAALNRKSLL